jgi:hypothetical protein
VLTVFGARERGRQTYLSQASRAKLPPDARYVEIAGGNHEQFGYYTGQFMGTLAEVDRETQQAEAVAATVSLLERVQAIVISRGR